jgi:hypothetical protein
VSFLSPWTALVAAAIALPLLLLLYFLKLRRQTLRVPSTLLWRKSFEDLQVNAPFQRLRWSALLVLQLLMLLALLAALAEPLWRGGEAHSSRVVIVIDRSASMNAPLPDEIAQEDGRPPVTRLDAAKQAAIDIIDALGRRGAGGPSQAMIIAFGSTAQVVNTFETNRGVLRDAVNAITPTDEESNLDAALQLASAFAGSRDETNATASDADAPPEVVLLSDGNVADAGHAFSLRAGEFRFVQVASDESGAPDPPAIDNLGIVALGARRDYEDPARVVVFARLLNASPIAIDTVVTLSLDGQAAATIRRSVGAASPDAPGEATLSHALDLPGGAVVTLAHNHADQLAADDVAALVLPPPAQPRIALVHESSPQDSASNDPPVPGPDPYLHELLAASEPQRLDVFTIDAWNQMDAATIDSGSRHDLVIFDRVSGQRLPGVPSISFGGVPAGVREAGASDDQRAGSPILSWDRQHPVLRNLSLDSIVYSGFTALDLPQSAATPLAWGRDGPIIALLRTRGARHLLVGFAMRKSNWPLHVSSAMFVQNALEFLTLGGNSHAGGIGGAGFVYRPGEVISLRAAPDAQVVFIEGPGHNVSVPAEPGAVVNLPAFRRAGIYRAAGAMRPNTILAVSVLSDVESDIRPRNAITVNAQAAEALSGSVRQPVPLWPWLLAAALALAVIEWLIYCRRIA